MPKTPPVRGSAKKPRAAAPADRVSLLNPMVGKRTGYSRTLTQDVDDLFSAGRDYVNETAAMLRDPAAAARSQLDPRAEQNLLLDMILGMNPAVQVAQAQRDFRGASEIESPWMRRGAQALAMASVIPVVGDAAGAGARAMMPSFATPAGRSRVKLGPAKPRTAFDLARRTEAILRANPSGATIDPATGKLVDITGKSVVANPPGARQLLTQGRTPTMREIEAAIDDNRLLFERNPDTFLGWYMNPQGKGYLEPSEVLADAAEAMRRAGARNEEAVFDGTTFENIANPSYDPARPNVSKPVRVPPGPRIVQGTRTAKAEARRRMDEIERAVAQTQASTPNISSYGLFDRSALEGTAGLPDDAFALLPRNSNPNEAPAYIGDVANNPGLMSLLTDAAVAGQKTGGSTWYDPRAVYRFAEEQGIPQADAARFLSLMGPTSPQNTVFSNIGNASILNRGLLRARDAGMEFDSPEGLLAFVTGANRAAEGIGPEFGKYFMSKGAMGDPLERLQAGTDLLEPLSFRGPNFKAVTFGRQLRGRNLTNATVDSHAIRGLTYGTPNYYDAVAALSADGLSPEQARELWLGGGKASLGSPSGPAYVAAENVIQQIAERGGMTGAQAQAGLWNTLRPVTGTKTPDGDLTSLLEQSLVGAAVMQGRDTPDAIRQYAAEVLAGKRATPSLLKKGQFNAALRRADQILGRKP